MIIHAVNLATNVKSNQSKNISNKNRSVANIPTTPVSFEGENALLKIFKEISSSSLRNRKAELKAITAKEDLPKAFDLALKIIRTTKKIQSAERLFHQKYKNYLCHSEKALTKGFFMIKNTVMLMVTKMVRL
jgi:hypothetical protein